MWKVLGSKTKIAFVAAEGITEECQHLKISKERFPRKVDSLKDYLRERGLKVTGRKEELVALVYGASQLGVAIKPGREEQKIERARQYRDLLIVSKNREFLPDPFAELTSGWLNEDTGKSQWPPCMIGDIQQYLINKEEKELSIRLLSDYKEGKAYSYFDSKWLQEVFYHPITKESQYCFLKAFTECSPHSTQDLGLLGENLCSDKCILHMLCWVCIIIIMFIGN